MSFVHLHCHTDYSLLDGRVDLDYSRRIPDGLSLKEKLRHLARVRTEEGYMAEVKPDGHG